MESIDRYVKIKLLEEKQKREALFKAIQEIVLANFTLSKLAVKRGKVQNLVAAALKMPANARFKRLVTKALKEIGIRAVCNQKTYLYRGIHDQAALEAWEEKERQKAIRKAERQKSAALSSNGPSDASDDD